jgi:hypothetical protein
MRNGGAHRLSEDYFGCADLKTIKRLGILTCTRRELKQKEFI